MSSSTLRLNLPYIAAGQAQKHVTHNQALDLVDTLMFLAVESAGSNAPPASPAEGVRHIVGPAPTGAWSGNAQAVAVWQDGGWTFLSPAGGWKAWSIAASQFQVFDGAAWQALATGTGGGDTLGIHTTADTTNRLAVASAASLFTHDGAGHQLKINKATAGATGSVLFQTGFSGRAEMGLAGNNDFQIKISSDGTNWTSALAIDEEGRVGINRSGSTARLAISGTDTTGTVPDFQVVRDNYYALSFCEAYSSSAAGHSPQTILRRARGTLAAPEAVLQGDQIGGLAFRARAPSGTFAQSALINATVSGTPAGSAVPTDMTLCTGTTGALERMRVTSGGDVGIGTSAPSTRLHVNGPVRVGTSTVAALPSATTLGAGTILYVSNAAGGAELAYSDGTNWRRASDRTVVT